MSIIDGKDSFKNKNVLVVGAARSGTAAARLLKKLGACVTISDSKALDVLKDVAEEMEGAGVSVSFGQNAGYELVKKHSLVIASPGVPSDIETFEIARREGIPVMGELELAFTLCECPVAAITGTNGKTTTAALAGEIIKRHITDAVVAGNIGSPFSECCMSLNRDGIAVVEASSFQLEDVSVFKPKISAILNITPDHLDRHKTFEKYIEAKTNIYKYTDEGCHVIFNYDDPVLRQLNVETGAKLLYFSVSGEKVLGAYLKGGALVINTGGGERVLIDKAELQMPGAHNVANALAAALIAVCAGVPEEVIARGLREFKGVPHRIEFVRQLRGVRYYNDSKGTNPDASMKALCAMDGKTVLIAGGYEKKADFNEFAALFKSKLSCVIAIGETKQQIVDASIKNGFDNCVCADSLEQAVKLSAERAVQGENVLLSPACASWDMFPDYEKRGDCFRDLVKNLE